ncbi:MAG: SGNH/GDSL hydrolase family protein [Thermoanaerobaculia bacterium]
MSRRRKFLLWLLALLVLGELAVRAVEALEGGTGSLYDYVVPVGKRFKLRPDTRLIVPERYGDVDYRFNRQGYRDDEPAAGAGVRRIVLLGDSVAFGLGVDQDRIFASLLERRLGPPWEVDNLAVFAYHSGNELEALETDGVKLRPELVVVQFYMNDFSIPTASGGPEPPPGLGQRLTAVKNRLLYSSALYRRLHQAAAGLAYLAAHDARRRWFPETLNKAEPVSKLALLEATPDDERVAAFRVLRQIRDVARAHGARTLILLMPDEVQLFTPRYDGINRRFAAFCAKEGIDLLDPLPALRASPERADFYLDGVHLTERGHQEVAGLLFDELRRSPR